MTPAWMQMAAVVGREMRLIANRIGGTTLTMAFKAKITMVTVAGKMLARVMLPMMAPETPSEGERERLGLREAEAERTM